MKNKTFLIIILCISIFYSCKKDEQTNNPAVVSGDPVAEFIAAHKTPTQHFTLNAATGGTITAAGGSIFIFAQNAFVNSSGTMVTGSIDVQIDEFISKKDLIFNGISTVSDGRPLKSGGAFRLRAFSGANELSPAPGVNYVARLTAASSEPQMEVYKGISTSSQYGNINWATTTGTVTTQIIDSITVLYEMGLEGFNFVNCDHPYDSAAFSVMNIDIPAEFNLQKTYVVDVANLMVVALQTTGGAAHWNYAPLNRQFAVFSFSSVNNNWKLTQKTVWFNSQQIVMPAAQSFTESQVAGFIDNL